MYAVGDLRKGLKIEIEGVPYLVTEFSFLKPGKGQAVYTCRLKNLLTGSTMTKSYRSNESFGEPNIEEKKLRYSYKEGEDFVFVDENYEQVSISAEVLGNSKYFLSEDMPVEVLFYNGQPIEVTLPFFIEKKIIHTEPGARGNTATNVFKPAKIEGDFEIHVPLFINQGDIVRIDTRTGEYVDRVSK
ncbi:MAG: elongation factor P [Kiritimatiellae bacterium]|nr:elongation factor P [Kiritimatiellia bacterium]MDD5522348.1 elongation factor P [Kiritimatiellia bacterium]